jgi:Family of unknown function (DUF6521)
VKTWLERPREEAYLLNPAFSSSAIAAAISGYNSVKKEGTPFPLVFMFLPITLHRATRESLPPSVRTSLVIWLQENSITRVLFYERLVSLKPHTREALHFGLLSDWFFLADGGLVQTTKTEKEINKIVQMLDDEARECILRARFVGKWFASAGTPQTVMALWGIQP